MHPTRYKRKLLVIGTTAINLANMRMLREQNIQERKI